MTRFLRIWLVMLVKVLCRWPILFRMIGIIVELPTRIRIIPVVLPIIFKTNHFRGFAPTILYVLRGVQGASAIFDTDRFPDLGVSARPFFVPVKNRAVYNIIKLVTDVIPIGGDNGRLRYVFFDIFAISAHESSLSLAK